MSILGQAESGEVVGFIVLSLLTLAGAATAWRLGYFRKDSVLGPERVGGEQGGWPLLVVLLLGTSAWLGTQIGLATYKQVMWTRAGHEGQFQMKDLTAGDYAFLSTVPGIVAVLVIAVSLRMFAKEQRPRLGVNHEAFPAGVTRGIAGVFLILPLVLWVSTLTEWVYRAVEFKHPTEHELLRAMKEAGPVVRWTLIVGAVAVAPVIEELLFRGLFQTLLMWAFNRRLTPPQVERLETGPGFPIEGVKPVSPDAPPASVPVAMPPVVDLSRYGSPGRLAFGRWMAILITSVVFAGIHDKWSVPPIFVLALCLGFAYERTGSLWVTMSIHALFNGFQTLFYLLLVAK